MGGKVTTPTPQTTQQLPTKSLVEPAKQESALKFLPQALGETALEMGKDIAKPFTRTAGTLAAGATALVKPEAAPQEGDWGKKTGGMLEPYSTKTEALKGAGEIGLTLAPETKEAKAAFDAVLELNQVMKGRTMMGLGKPVEEKAADLMTKAIGGGKGLIQKVEVRQGKNLRDIAKFMAKEKAIPEVVDNKISWSAARTAQEEAVRADEQALQAELAKTPRTVSVSWSKISGKAKEGINKIFKSAVEREEAKASVDEIVEAEKNALGHQPSLSQLNESKKGMWQLGYAKGDPKQALRGKVGRQIGHAILEEIKAKAKNKAIGEILERMANRMDAMGVMDAVEGVSAKTGGAAKYASGAIGAIAGQAIPIPVVGPVAGYEVGSRIGQSLARRAPIKAAKTAAKLMTKAIR